MQELRALVAGREVSVSLVDRRPLLPPSQGGRLGGVVDRKLRTSCIRELFSLVSKRCSIAQL